MTFELYALLSESSTFLCILFHVFLALLLLRRIGFLFGLSFWLALDLPVCILVFSVPSRDPLS